jgi:multiple antibiotic resistance protein
VSDLTLDGELYVTSFVTVLVLMDPIGNVPIFLGLTRSLDERDRNRASLVGSLVALGVIVTFAVFGQRVLDALSISLEALQIAGGLLLLLIALELLRGGEGPGAEQTATDGGTNLAMVPLGTPLLAGPGAIAATMLYSGQADDLGGDLTVLLALLSAIAVVYLALRFSGLIARIVRPAGIHLLSRLMGLIAAAIAVQLIANALQVWADEGVS